MKPFFSNREIRALVLFLPLAGILGLAVWLMRPKSDPGAAERLNAEPAGQLASEKKWADFRDEEQPEHVELFCFDPNTIDYAGLRRLGIEKKLAVSLLKYRAAGKIFRIPEDIAVCYGFTDSLYFRLEPYIRIGSKYAPTPQRSYNEKPEKPSLAPAPFRLDTVSALYLRAISGLTKRQAEAIVERSFLRGIRDMEELRACYGVTDSMAKAWEPYVIFPERRNFLRDKVNLNTADSAALCAVSGIGEKSAGAIVRYRERLGGFCRVEQLAEIPEVTERNYERILKQIVCDSCEIQKIDINFATPNTLMRHPYLSSLIVRKVLKARQLKGGWTSIGELVEQNILTREEAARLAPYLRFGVQESRNN